MINLDKALCEYRRGLSDAFRERLEGLADLLASDVMSGPFYLTEDKETGEAYEGSGGEVFRVCSWGESGAGSTLWGSRVWLDALTMLREFVENHPKYYDADSGEWLEREPEAFWCDPSGLECSGWDVPEDAEEAEALGYFLVEPNWESLYLVDSKDIWRSLVGRAADDLMHA